MDQKKIGAFMKELRREKGMTQENLAEVFGVSARTVSRWETGFNMPDLDILMQMSDYYDVDIRELLDGERKSENMNKELEETVVKIAEYSNDEKKRLARRLSVLFLVAIVAFVIYMVLDIMNRTDLYNGRIADTALGLSFGMLIVGFMYTSGLLMKIKMFKKRLQKRL